MGVREFGEGDGRGETTGPAAYDCNVKGGGGMEAVGEWWGHDECI